MVKVSKPLKILEALKRNVEQDVGTGSTKREVLAEVDLVLRQAVNWPDWRLAELAPGWVRSDENETLAYLGVMKEEIDASPEYVVQRAGPTSPSTVDIKHTVSKALEVVIQLIEENLFASTGPRVG